MTAESIETLYRTPLACESDVAGFRAEGPVTLSFPQGRMRVESTVLSEDSTQGNFVLWCPEEFGPDVEYSWDFWPIREPGLCIVFFAARGRGDVDLFDASLSPRDGDYPQYHSGDIDAYHLSYFRRRIDPRLHTCNLRKSHGFHLVATAPDPIPPVATAVAPYRIRIRHAGARVSMFVDDLLVLDWYDDGSTGGPALGRGRFGFRQMSPMIAEYANFEARSLTA